MVRFRFVSLLLCFFVDVVFSLPAFVYLLAKLLLQHTYTHIDLCRLVSDFLSLCRCIRVPRVLLIIVALTVLVFLAVVLRLFLQIHVRSIVRPRR